MIERKSRIASLSAKQRALLARRMKNKAKAVTALPAAVPRRPSGEPGVLSFAQERFWFLDRWQPESSAYNLLDSIRISGRLDVCKFATALREVMRRHEALRTVFVEVEGLPCPETRPTPEWPLTLVDLEALPVREGERVAQALSVAESRRPFDLARGPLLRACLLRFAAGEHLLLLNLHHIVSDLWSFGVLIREVGEGYRRLHGGDRTPLPEPPIQYGDFAAWQRRRLSGETLEQQLGHWREELAGAPLVLDLPIDRSRPPVQTDRGGRHVFTLPAPLGRALRTLGQRAGATPFMILLAALQALLHRYTGAEDFLLGSPVAGRIHPQLEPLIGVFVNTLVMRADLSERPSFETLLGRTRERTLEALAHQELPFEILTEALQPERDLSRPAVVQALFAVVNAPIGSLQLPGLKLTDLGQDSGTAKFDVSLTFAEAEGRLCGTWIYNADLFHGSTLERFSQHFERLLEGALAEPGLPISDLSLLGEAERRQLQSWQGERAAPAPFEALHQRFDIWVDRQGAAPAVRYGACAWTYRELGERADRLAWHLLAANLAPEERVGVYIGISPWFLVAVLGISKAGGAFLALDPAFPPQRLMNMAAEAGVRRLLVAEGEEPEETLAEIGSVAIDQLPPLEQGTPVAARPINPSALAYVLYTSGSTGRPKGVMVEHQGLMRYLDWVGEVLMANGHLPLPAVTRPSFDGSYRQLLAPLMRGEAVVFPDSGGDPMLLMKELFQGGATGFTAVPSLWSSLLMVADLAKGDLDSSDGQLRRLILGGEAFEQALLDRTFSHFGPDLEIWNCYGPTEVTVNATAARLNFGESVHIGRPIAGAEVMVLDRDGQRVPVGISGQLLVAGRGLARGYLGQPATSAERFLPHPESTYPGDRIYATGDLVRYLPTGNLQFLGRLDQQVKLRGFRIELGEIEAQLAGLPAVSRAVVLVRQVAGEGQLVAYLSGGELPEDESLTRHLRQTLPDFMLPSFFVRLESWPQTATGKLDRRRLPTPEPDSAGQGQTPPQTLAERALASIWCEVLALESVGREDDFFALGGHSLLVVRLLARIRKDLAVELSMRVPFEAPTLMQLAERIEGARAELAADRAPLPNIVPVSRDQDLPLSFPQERLWFLDQLDPGLPVYNISGAVRILGDVTASRLGSILAVLIERHEVLRTVYRLRGTQPVQVVGSAVGWPLKVADLSHLSTVDKEAEARRQAVALSGTSFDLSAGPPLRFLFLDLGCREQMFVFTLHHILADGWSLGVMLREVTALLGGEMLAPLPVQYADFSHWQRSHFEEDGLQAQLKYWRQCLAAAPPVLDLPADRPRPPVQTFRGALARVDFKADLLPRLNVLAQAHQATLFMVLLAGFGTLLHRLSGSRDLVVGSPIAGRHQAEVDGLIGFFVNNLALRLDFSGGPSFEELLSRARETALGAYAHQDVPFERLVEEVNPERSLGHFPIFQVVLALQEPAFDVPAAPAGIELEPVELDSSTAKVDLELHVWPADGRLAGGVTYSTDLFDRATLERWMGHFAVLLDTALAEPGLALERLDILSATERRQILLDGVGRMAHGGHSVEPSVAPVRIAHWAAETPGALALRSVVGDLSYGELEAEALALGQHLVALGAGPGTLVAVCLERGVSLVSALYAVWKTGGAYLPLDPSYPDTRLRFMLEDSASVVLVTDEAHRGQLAGEGWRTLLIDEPGPPPLAAISFPEVSGEHLAYVIYTSGSTGKPKGVSVPQKALACYIAWHQRALNVGPGTRGSQITSPGFDASVAEIWAHLAVGGSVHLASELTRRSPELLRDWMVAEKVEIALMPAPLAEGVLALDWPAATRLRYLLSGGDRLRRYAPADLPFTLLNNYGPTETTILVTSGPVATASPRIYPDIGSAIDHAEAYVVNRSMEPQPVGVVGELLIGGGSLARGYLGRPSLSAERFMPHPWSPRLGARLYCTGDLVRWLVDGRLDFLGRLDQQIQLRGIRVEPGEIEAALAEHPAVAAAALAIRGEEAQDLRLDAYAVAVAGSVLDAADLRTFLGERLPSALVPATVTLLDALPLDVHGKVDRKALPEPAILAGSSEGAEASGRAPSTPAEELMLAIWVEVLGRQDFGVEQDFFALGGHSLLATQVTARVRELFGIELSLQAMFEAPTVAALAGRLALAVAGQDDAPPPIVPADRTALLPLSFAQERLWFLDRLEPGSAAYNIPLALRALGQLELEALRRALSEVLRRHQVLRTVFAEEGGVPHQVIQPVSPDPPPVIDLSALGESHRQVVAGDLLVAEAARAFDLAGDPMLRLTVLHLGAKESWISLILHHIAGDGWSFGVLVREIEVIYRAALAGGSPVLPELPLQYADYAAWQRQWLSAAVLESHVEWWRGRLEGVSTVLALPWDRPQGRAEPRRAGHCSLRIGAAPRRQLEELCQSRQVTLFMALLAVFQVFLHRLTQQDDLAVGTPVAGRDRIETEGLIGFFVNTLVLRSNLADGAARDLSFEEHLRRVRGETLEVFAHREVPFEKLVEALQPERRRHHNPFFQAFFSFGNLQDSRLELPGLALTPLDVAASETKFDLLLRLGEEEDCLVGELVFVADRMDPSTVERMARQFLGTLNDVLRDPTQPLSHLSLLNAAERHQTLVEWPLGEKSGIDPTCGGEPCLHRWIAAQAARTPEAVAIAAAPRAGAGAPECLTWRALEGWALALAGELRAAGVGPDTAVGLCAERSPGMVVGMLAILQAGGAFVPLDPGHPRAHLQQILGTVRPPVVLVQREVLAALPESFRRQDRQAGTLLFLDPLPPVDPADCALPEVVGENLAYLISTSGSSGRPKLVMTSHGAITRHLAARQGLHPLGPSDRFLHLAPMSFEMAIWEIFWPLVAGAQLLLSPPGSERDPADLVSLVAREGVTALRFTPAMLELVLARPGLAGWRGVRHIFTGAESLSWELAARHAARLPGSLHHLYGPTETCVTVSHFLTASPSRAPKVPIGSAFGGAELFVLDSHFEPVPVGQAGELLIGGPGLARGYFIQPSETAHRFIPHPWGRGGERLYRSGDLVRWLVDGRLDFLGRIDRQVKVRGVRVELEHVEGVLGEAPGVVEVAVSFRPGEGGRLTAWVVGGVAAEELRSLLRQRLPEAMVPAFFGHLDALPRTRHGKIDRRALLDLEPDGKWASSIVSDQPKDALEEALVEVWEEVLDRSGIGVRQSFFDLGGHSLLAVRLFDRIASRLGHSLPLASLFEGATVAEQAVLLRQAGRAAESSAQEQALVPILRAGDGAPLFLVHPIGGSVFCYRELALELSCRSPDGLSVYGLEARLPEPGQGVSIEAMAERYLAEVRSLQPGGPYRLGGWSMGASVAFEMARQLRRDGAAVALLALLDPPPPGWLGAAERSPHEQLAGFGRDLAGLGSGENLGRAVAAAGAEALLAALLSSDQDPGPIAGFDLRPFRHPFALYRANAHALGSYRPSAFDLGVDLTLVLARASEDQGAAYGEDRGWGRLVAGRAGVHRMPGGHYDLLRRPTVLALAELLSEGLENLEITRIPSTSAHSTTQGDP